MTVQELYEYAKEKNLLDCEVRIKYRDAGGEYPSTDPDLYLVVKESRKVLVL